jgi:hypothetical protein
MTCIGCSSTKPVLNCITNLKIGTLANSTSYYTYFKNSSSGKINRITTTSSNVGVLNVALDFTPLAKSQYEIWVTLASSTDLEEKETILIDGIEVTCLYTQFQRVYGSGNSTLTATNQTLALS